MMKLFFRSFIIALLILLIVTSSFAAGYISNQKIQDNRTQFLILSQAYDILISHGYSDPPPDPLLEYGMIKGMISAYGDPYTSFIEPAQHELDSNILQGTFGGIGVELGKDIDGYYCKFIYPDSPSAQAGIIEGDRILKVDSLLISPETPLEEVQAAIRGPVGENVQVTIFRPPSFTEIEYSVKYREIPIPSIIWYREPAETRLGIIQTNIISATTRDEIINAVDDLQTRGVTAFVLDLRDNSGGLLDAGIEIARLFLSSGKIIEQQYRNSDVETFSVIQPGELELLPLVVLVNHNTASAAEIIAGSLQANDRAILIGAPTYGKDTIQLIFDLRDGSSIHITAAHWWIPDFKEPIANHGLQPDILIDPTTSSSVDPFINAAILYFFSSE